MDKSTRNAALAAAVILAGFGLLGYFMPVIMLTLGESSPWVGVLVAALFVAAFFGLFWLRGRSQRGRNGQD